MLDYHWDKFCIPVGQVAKFKELVSQHGLIVQDEYPDGWTSGRYVYITVETTDTDAWRMFTADYAAKLGGGANA